MACGLLRSRAVNPLEPFNKAVLPVNADQTPFRTTLKTILLTFTPISRSHLRWNLNLSTTRIRNIWKARRH